MRRICDKDNNGFSVYTPIKRDHIEASDRSRGGGGGSRIRRLNRALSMQIKFSPVMGDPVGEPRQKKRRKGKFEMGRWGGKRAKYKGFFLASRLVLLIDATIVQLRK